jgi:hypothetical protein
MTTRRAAACLQPDVARSMARPADLLGADAEEWRRLIKTLGLFAES